MTIDAFASMPHLVEHLAPIWRALPDSLRGTFQSAGMGAYRAGALGIQLGQLRRERGSEAPLTLVASYMDEQYVRPRPVVLVEHGAGQSYGHDPGAAQHPSYPGGQGRERVVLFVCPSERVAQRWRDMYPETPTAVVGCPFLDPWHLAMPIAHEDRYHGELPLVVFTFHWDCPVVPETKSAFPHYQQELVRLAKLTDEERGFRMGGHAHPRAPEIFGFWRKWDVPTFERFAEVLSYADCLVFDNTSAGFEFASTDRPVVVLNAPWYRRDVHHGGRFWEWADVGIQVDGPDDEFGGLQGAIEAARADLWSRRQNRHRVVADVYAYTDGHATERAVKAIIECYERGDWQNWRETRDGHNPFAPA